MSIVIACGGTGGHIFPGIAVANVLQKYGKEVVLWLTGRNVEKLSVQGWNGPVVSIKSTGLPTTFSFKTIRAVMAMAYSLYECHSIMKKHPPEAVLAMGGYGSVGPVLSARSLNIPVILHEANAIPGRAVSILSPFANTVAVSFEVTTQYFKHARTVFTGFPIRRLTQEKVVDPLKPNHFTLLVTGGSQGAHRLNEICSEAIVQLHNRGKPVQVIHITGLVDEKTVKAKYEKHGVIHIVYPFCSEMGKIYYSADLAIARAGAGTCMELTTCKLPAIFVPLPYAPRDHQTANARIMQTAGHDMIPESKFTPQLLINYIEQCMINPDKLMQMKQRLACSRIVVPDADVRIAEVVMKNISLFK